MLSFDTTLMDAYLIVVFSLAAIAVALSLGVITTEVVHRRGIPLARHESPSRFAGRPLAS